MNLLKKTLIDENDLQIKKEIITIIIDYLNSIGFHSSIKILQQESQQQFYSLENFIHNENEEIKKNENFKIELKKAIIDGNWNEVEKLCLQNPFKNIKSFLYSVYKQAYLELLSKHEYQKALTILTKKLKPLESRQSNPSEFRDLCYILTCKSIHHINSLNEWEDNEDIIEEREKLIQKFEAIFEFDNNKIVKSNPNRLLELFRQAIAFQINTKFYNPRAPPKIKSLLEDYHFLMFPNSLLSKFIGHKDNVKCVDFVGIQGNYIVSGSSDNTLKIWSMRTNKCLCTLKGHLSRVWDVSSNKEGTLIASASGDSTIKLWKINSSNVVDENQILMNSEEFINYDCIQTLIGHQGDVYTVRFHPGQNHIVTGGYDKNVKLYDITTGKLKKNFSGHNSSVSRAIFNPSGNLIITGSKDNTIKFWDIMSGICIKTIHSHFGEITSIEINTSGTLLLSASKDNSNRLWETSTSRPIKRFKGHQNTSKNFVRAGFGPKESLIIGGSEDGFIYIWDIETANILQKLYDQKNIVIYSAAWNENQSLLASCSNDNIVRTWYYDKNKSLYYDDKE